MRSPYSGARRRGVLATALLILLAAPVRETSAGCGGEGFGTLAYVVSYCRAEGRNVTAWQELRIRRGRCEPVTVVRFASPTPVPDPFGLCNIVAENHYGQLSSLAGVFLRLGVTRDGSAVVFEVSNQFQLTGRTPLSDEEQGFFWVRSDGTGLRRLGPASRNPPYRIFVDPHGGGASSDAFTELAFSHNGRWVAFPGRGPGPDGVEREQAFVLNTRTGEQRQLTSLPAETPLPFGRPAVGGMNIFHGEVSIIHNVGDGFEAVTVGLDGGNYRTQPPATAPRDIGGKTVPAFGVARAGQKYWGLRRIEVPGAAVTADLFEGPITELFNVLRGGRVIQLTNLRAADTAELAVYGRTVLFWSSADPFGTNPWRNRQMFTVSQLGGKLRQLTHFANTSQLASHRIGEQWGCFIKYVNQGGAGPGYHFYSDCDPFGTNPDGSEVFAIDYKGHLEQLTETAGVRRHADGVLEVELPGPSARGP